MDSIDKYLDKLIDEESKRIKLFKRKRSSQNDLQSGTENGKYQGVELKRKSHSFREHMSVEQSEKDISVAGDYTKRYRTPNGNTIRGFVGDDKKENYGEKKINDDVAMINTCNIEKCFYENHIDPLWYLVEGPFVIFPRELLPKLTIHDFVEYYRAYPRLNWSKYPKLKREIFKHLTRHERRMMDQYESYHREYYDRYVRLYNFIDFSFYKKSSREDISLFIRQNYRKLIQDFLHLCKLWIVRYAWNLFSYYLNMSRGP